MYVMNSLAVTDEEIKIRSSHDQGVEWYTMRYQRRSAKKSEPMEAKERLLLQIGKHFIAIK